MRIVVQLLQYHSCKNCKIFEKVMQELYLLMLAWWIWRIYCTLILHHLIGCTPKRSQLSVQYRLNVVVRIRIKQCIASLTSLNSLIFINLNIFSSLYKYKIVKIKLWTRCVCAPITRNAHAQYESFNIYKKIMKPRKGLITMYTNVKYQRSSTHFSKVISKVKVFKKWIKL